MRDLTRQDEDFYADCLPQANFYTVKLRKYDVQVFKRYNRKEKNFRAEVCWLHSLLEQLGIWGKDLILAC